MLNAVLFILAEERQRGRKRWPMCFNTDFWVVGSLNRKSGEGP